MYRSLLVSVVLLVGVAAGAWIAWSTALPLEAAAGGAVGAVAALGVAYAMVHDFHHRYTSPSPRSVRRR